jgi:arylformamidase
MGFRKDEPCGQAKSYAAKSEALGVRASVLPKPMGHGAINQQLGLVGGYADAVEAFLVTLDPSVAKRLQRNSRPSPR